MTDITRLNPHERAALRERAGRVCVVFTDHRLPTGFVRETGRIGIEADSTGATLFVDRVAYEGDDTELAAWSRMGRRRFTTLDGALDWYRQKLSDGGAAVASASLSLRPVVADVSTLVDTDEVARLVDTAAPLSEQAITEAISEVVLAQHEAVSSLASLVSRQLAKPHPRRPASALLLGPTGVGKTQTAEAIAELLRERAGFAERIRYDLAEFTEQHSVARLIGSPPGYVGYGDTSLASLLAADSRRIVIFDEIDKAHPLVLTTLMNLLDAGRLDSARHGEVSALHAILLFTSNAGGTSTLASAPTDDSSLRRGLIDAGLRPEVVGRFGRVVRFASLDGSGRAAVVARSFAVIAADYGVELTHVDAQIVASVIDEVDRMRLGARGVEHLIDRRFGAQLGSGVAGPQALVMGNEGQAVIESALRTSESRLE
jgi:energy-coupling factor transporter ATP-binding protein EcfA2